jgi:hypothetical protein
MLECVKVLYFQNNEVCYYWDNIHPKLQVSLCFKCAEGKGIRECIQEEKVNNNPTYVGVKLHICMCVRARVLWQRREKDRRHEAKENSSLATIIGYNCSERSLLDALIADRGGGPAQPEEKPGDDTFDRISSSPRRRSRSEVAVGGHSRGWPIPPNAQGKSSRPARAAGGRLVGGCRAHPFRGYRLTRGRRRRCAPPTRGQSPSATPRLGHYCRPRPMGVAGWRGRAGRASSLGSRIDKSSCRGRTPGRRCAGSLRFRPSGQGFRGRRNPSPSRIPNEARASMEKYFHWPDSGARPHASPGPKRALRGIGAAPTSGSLLRKARESVGCGGGDGGGLDKHRPGRPSSIGDWSRSWRCSRAALTDRDGISMGRPFTTGSRNRVELLREVGAAGT